MRILRAALFLGLAALLVGAAAFLLTRKRVTLVVDGEASEITTRARTVGALLAQQGLAISPEDHLIPDASEALQNGSTVTLETVRPVVIWADGEAFHLFHLRYSLSKTLLLG
ncbi:MAG: ubiquitin-like domain-containing protein [Anaerolineales bacterium]|nr:ubiquitin-like domain-containing protein [Anaerolineales bacterium]